MKSWWDEVPYSDREQQHFQMQIEASPSLETHCGFIKLRERHRVKAERTPVNSQDRHCRISKVKPKG